MALIHHWKLDEDSGALVDTVAGLNGTATGTTPVPGLFGKARLFASGNYISLPANSDLNFGANPHSVFAWVRLDSIPSAIGTIMALYDNNGGQRSWAISCYPQKVSVWMSPDGVNVPTILDSPFDLNVGELHQVGYTKSGTTVTIYTDGVAVISGTAPATLYSNTVDNAYIGNLNPEHQYYFPGVIDNVQVWDTALSATEVNNLYYKSLNSLVIANQVPLPEASGVARDTNIQLSVVDSVNNIDLTTVDIWVKGTPAYDGATDTFQTGFDGPASVRTGTSAQYDFTIDPTSDFAYDDTVSVRVYAENDISNVLDETYQFYTTQDITAPSLDNRDPAPSQIDVRWKSDVYLEIYETETLVQRNTIKVYVAGTLAFDGTSFQSGFTGTVLPADATAARYYVTVNPDTNFSFSTSVTIRVVARNTSVPYEELDTSYNFTTEAKSISLTDRDPAPSETNVRTIKSPVVAVQDTTYNVVPESVDIYVDGHLAYDGTTNTFQAGYDGPGSQRTGTPAKYTYTIDPTVNFAFSDTIPIRVVAANDDDQPLDETYSFTTKAMVYYDKGVGGKILYVDTTSAIALPGVGLVYIRDPMTPYIDDLQLPNGQLTVEARVIPALSATSSYLLTGAEMVLGFNHAGMGFWSYVAKGQTNTFIHEKLVGLRAKVDNYLALRHVFGDAASTAMIMNGTAIVGRWYGSFPAQVAGTGAITAFANIGGGIVRVTSAGHGMATGTWARIYGTTNYNDVFQIANAQPNTFDITATWAGDDGAGSWTKTNDAHNLAGWSKPAFAVGDYNVALGHDDVLVMLSMNSVAKTAANLLEIARGRL